MTQANKKVELYYRIGDNPNFSGTDQWLRAETQDGTNAVTYFEYEHSLHKPAEARVTLINSIPNFRAGDIDSKSGKLSILASGDDAATNSDLFTDFMRVQLIDAHSKIIYLSGRIYDVEAEYNRLEGHTVKLIIKDDLEILRGVYVDEVGDTAYTGSTKRSVLIKDELIGDDNFDTPSELAMPIDFSDPDKFEASANNFNGSGTLKYSTSNSSMLQEISHLATQDPSSAVSDRVVTNTGYDFYLDPNVGRDTGTDVDNAGADTRTPSNSHFNYFKRGTRPAGSNSVATYGLTVEFPTAAFTKTGQKLPMSENFDFDRPKHETFTDATITGIITGGKPVTKNFEVLDVTSISGEFTWTDLAFSDTDISVATGSLTDVTAQAAGTDFAETLNLLNADGSGSPVAVARIQYQSTNTGSGQIMISDVNSSFPEGTTQVMLKGASSNTTCLFTPSTGRLREKIGLKRTYKMQYGTYERFDDFRKLIYNILKKGGRSNIVRGSFTIAQYPYTFVNFTPSGSSDTVTAALSSGNPKNYGMRTGMPIGILNSSGTFLEFYNYASAVGTGSVAVASVPQDKSGNTTKNFSTSSITARFYVPVRAGDMIHVENPIEAIDGDFLVTKIVYTEGTGAMNARLEVVGKDDALGGKGPKITFTPVSQDFNTDAEHIQERNKNFSFPVDGSNNTVKFSATDHNTIAWTAGPLKIGETTYAISATNTGDMVAYNASNPHNTTYKLYFDPRTSTTAIQVVRADGWDNVSVGPTVTEIGNARAAAASTGLAECSIINNPDGIILGDSKVITGSKFQTKPSGTSRVVIQNSTPNINIFDDEGNADTQFQITDTDGDQSAVIKLHNNDVIFATADSNSENIVIWAHDDLTLQADNASAGSRAGAITAVNSFAIRGLADGATSTFSDPNLYFFAHDDVSGGSADVELKWNIGVDHDDSDKLKFDYKNATTGGATKMTLDASGNLTVTGSISGSGGSTALDDIGTGDAASTLATSAGNITIDAQGNNTDIIFKGTSSSSDVTMLTLDGSTGGDAILRKSLLFDSTCDTSTADGFGVFRFTAAPDGSGDDVLAFNAGQSHATPASANNDSVFWTMWTDVISSTSSRLHFEPIDNYSTSDGKNFAYIGYNQQLVGINAFYNWATSTSASLPAHSFSGDLDTGMYNISADRLGFATGGTQRLSIDSSGTTFNTLDTGASANDVTVTAAGLLKKVTSSKRYKENIVEMTTPSEKIYDLQPSNFSWKKTGKNDFGLIAEQVHEILPELSVLDEKGRPEAVRYTMLSVLLLNEVQKLKKEIEELKENK